MPKKKDKKEKKPKKEKKEKSSSKKAGSSSSSSSSAAPPAAGGLSHGPSPAFDAGLLFEKYDQSRSGTLTKAEFQAMMEDTGDFVRQRVEGVETKQTDFEAGRLFARCVGENVCSSSL